MAKQEERHLLRVLCFLFPNKLNDVVDKVVAAFKVCAIALTASVALVVDPHHPEAFVVQCLGYVLVPAHVLTKAVHNDHCRKYCGTHTTQG
jgi:hypothetical protein